MLKSRSRFENAGPSFSFPGSPDQKSVKGSAVLNGTVTSAIESESTSSSAL
jgi:hypothetical protein